MALIPPTPRPGANGTGLEGDAMGDCTGPKSSALEECLMSLKKRNRQEGGHRLELGVTPLAGDGPEEASLIRMVPERSG